MKASILATSKDGTTVAAARSGRGPALLAIHGIAADAGRFAGAAPPRLDEHFEVFAMDRRGRGASTDGPTYALEREAEDVAAMLEAIARVTGQPELFVFGHSFGGLVALEALLQTERIAKLVVYEPYAPPSPAATPSPITCAYQALADSGDHERLVHQFLSEIVQMSERDVARLHAHPSWAARLAVAPTIPREMAAAETYRFDPARFASVTVPIRMLLGGKSPPFLREATARLGAALPTSEILELEGQEHVAMDTAPSLFLASLRSFFG